jgi:hypothetical protein
VSVVVGCGCIVSDEAGRYLVVREAKESARGRYGLLRGQHVDRALDAYERGRSVPLPAVVPASRRSP